jgi:hypothetical protein
MYPHPTASYGGLRSGDPHALARRVHELCQQYAISERMPRPINPRDKRALNHRIVEALANECYSLRVELENAPKQRVWAYRKAAWTIQDTMQDLGLIYQMMGRKGLDRIGNVGPKMAEVVEGLINGLARVS